MSRRPNPAAEKAAKNASTLKALLKVQSNTRCADCKKAKHPRWASWNLGVFLCIRCAGIHRGLGTHLSRVKSADLDAWTDEQLQSILSWGNARANKYWEAKLAPGHVPSESKLENFIRTKYELKRWVMDGPMPDPASLDVEGDDDIPLSIVKEKQSIDRKESVRKSSVGQSAAPPPPAARQPEADLLGGDSFASPTPPARPQSASVPPKAQAAPPKATGTKDSLLGLDFLGTDPAPPPRPSSTTAAQSRPDLKQSILSLYATNPRPQAQQQQSSASFRAMSSPTMASHQTQGSMSGLNDSFSSLSFSTNTSASQKPAPPKPDPFSGLISIPTKKSATSSFSGLSGGSFFDTKPKTATHSQAKQPSISSPDPFASFSSPAPPKPAANPAPVPTSSGFGDLFDLATPAVTPASPPPADQPTSSSVFNLSSNAPKSPAGASPTTGIATSNVMGGFSSSGFSNSDVWGGNAWGAPAEPAKTPSAAAAAPKPASNDMGWGSGGSLANTSIVPGASGGFSTQPKVAADEEFGGWASSTGTNKPAGNGSGFGGGNNEDLFSNVWG